MRLTAPGTSVGTVHAGEVKAACAVAVGRMPEIRAGPTRIAARGRLGRHGSLGAFRRYGISRTHPTPIQRVMLATARTPLKRGRVPSQMATKNGIHLPQSERTSALRELARPGWFG